MAAKNEKKPVLGHFGQDLQMGWSLHRPHRLVPYLGLFYSARLEMIYARRGTRRVGEEWNRLPRLGFGLR